MDNFTEEFYKATDGKVERIYPWYNLLMAEDEKTQVLFICTANLNRSPTAAELVNSESGDKYEARSAGINSLAETTVTQAHVDWADIIVAMEEVHAKYLKDNFNIEGKTIYTLDIPDHYIFNDKKLLDILRGKLSDILQIQ